MRFCKFPLLMPLLLAAISGEILTAQTFRELPGYAQYAEASRDRLRLVRGGRVREIQWADLSVDPVLGRVSSRLSFKGSDGKKTFDLKNREFIDQHDFKRWIPPQVPAPPIRIPVARAEQRQVEPSSTGKWKALYRDFNVVIREKDRRENEIQVTTGGNARLRYGTCCWVYGEELDQDSAMWWSPDDRYLAFYEVSESHMRDYHLTVDNTKNYTRLKTVRYPKAGDPNPKVSIRIYELETKKTVAVHIPGDPTQYLYGVRWTPGGKELLVHRTNRHQNLLDVLAVDPASGKSRMVVSEKQESWQNNSPEMRFLSDGRRFFWETEKNGWKNYEIRDLSGKSLIDLTHAVGYPVKSIHQVDEKTGWFYYTAFSDENPYNLQLHRVRLDGTDDSRITRHPLNHTSFVISPDHQWVVATREGINTAPETVLYSAAGKEVAILESAQVAEQDRRYLKAEIFDFLASDGKTRIYGTLHKPSHFDPAKKYPLLIDVYGGPHSRGLSNRFNPVNPHAEFGFCIAKIGNRGTVERGKAFESANYLKLGGPDLDDQATGVKELVARDYIDGSRVGIYGHSYGGYLSALALLKYPDRFHVAVAGAPVTRWQNYDTIYTERYMRTPQENPKGYQEGNCMHFAENLRGRLLLVHGLIDDNVHPANTWQLAEALHRANKRFDMQIYPNFKHGIGSTYSQLRWEYLVQHLKPESPTSKAP